MTNFKTFKSNVLSLPGVWNDEKNIYFSQTRDGYSAAYKPHYPRGSKKDMIIQTIDKSGAYLRGNYELIIFLNTKYQSLYFQTLTELHNYLKTGAKQ